MNFIMQFLSKVFGWASPTFTGVVNDTRHESEKQKDYLHEERILPSAVDPFGNQQISDSKYPYYNQYQTYSCVPNAVGLALGIERELDGGVYQQIAPTFPYRLRSNYPQEGSSVPNIYDIYAKYGAPLYTTLPTPQDEHGADMEVLSAQMYTEAAIFKGKKYFTITNANNIDTLAEVASRGHGVSILIYATEEEYARQYPTIVNANLNPLSAPIRHCICILPNSGFMQNGVKYVTVQDSSYFGGWKIRYLSEAFIKARVYYGAYWDNVNTIGAGPRPHYTYSQTLRFGTRGAEVEKVQELLISEGLLPTGLNSGLFGGMTLAAIHAFQSKYAADILIPAQLTRPTDIWGPLCIKKANQLCAVV